MDPMISDLLLWVMTHSLMLMDTTMTWNLTFQRSRRWWKLTLRIWAWHRPLPCCWSKRISKWCVGLHESGWMKFHLPHIDIIESFILQMCICKYVIYIYLYFGILIGVSLPPDQMFCGAFEEKNLWTNSPRQVFISLITLLVRVALQHFFFGGGLGSESSFIIMNDLGFRMCWRLKRTSWATCHIIWVWPLPSNSDLFWLFHF